MSKKRAIEVSGEQRFVKIQKSANNDGSEMSS